jgi:DNA invertase Pin-like site-specific DNA recombinase
MGGNRTLSSGDGPTANQALRCAIYTRKSTEEGLNQEFNSLEAQREAAESYVASQRQLGWVLVAEHYDDGGYTGANLERPALGRLLEDIERGTVDCVLVYKIDRLSRSLLDFARLIEVFERHHVSLVSVTQPLNTTASLGRLTLNILLSFAQFEREMVSDRTRDKMAAARRKGKWVGGTPVLGYDIAPTGSKLWVNVEEAERVRAIFALYLQRGSLEAVLAELQARQWMTKRWRTRAGKEHPGATLSESRIRAVAAKRALCRPSRASGRAIYGRARSHCRAGHLGAGAGATRQSTNHEQSEEAAGSPKVCGRAKGKPTSATNYAAAGPGAEVRRTDPVWSSRQLHRAGPTRASISCSRYANERVAKSGSRYPGGNLVSAAGGSQATSHFRAGSAEAECHVAVGETTRGVETFASTDIAALQNPRHRRFREPNCQSTSHISGRRNSRHAFEPTCWRYTSQRARWRDHDSNPLPKTETLSRGWQVFALPRTRLLL